MSLDIAYAAMGGDLETVRARLRSDDRIEKFVKFFLQDPSMKLLEDSMAAQNYDEAFRGAHTLKGVSRDLGFTPLYEVSVEISDALRKNAEGQPTDIALAETLMPKIRTAYEDVLDAIAII